MPPTNPKRGPGRPRNPAPHTNIPLRLPDEQLAWIRAEAEAKGQTVVEFVRRVLAAYRKSVQGGRQAQQPTNRDKGGGVSEVEGRQ